MKTKTIVFLLALLLIVLAGCNNAPPNEDKPQPFSFSESVQSTSESEAPAGKESKEVETTPEAVQESEPEKQEETTETDTVSSEQPQTDSDNRQAAQSAEQPDKADKTEHSVSTPQPDIPKESETPEPPEMEETTSETKTDFDIDYWISFAKSYAESIGLVLDNGAVYCWDNPIAAGVKCKYTERDIRGYLDRYAKDGDITDVWIWYEQTGSGSYEIYIGYA